MSWFKTTSLPKNETALLGWKHPPLEGVVLPSSCLKGNPEYWEGTGWCTLTSTVWAHSLVSITLSHHLFLPCSGPAFSMQSFPKSFCCTFNRDLVQPPGDRAWRRMGEKMIKQERILLNRVRHFPQSLIMFRPDWRWNCIRREEKLPPLGQSRGSCTNLISSSVEDSVWFGWIFGFGCFVGFFLYAFNLISQEAVWKWERQTFDCDASPVPGSYRSSLTLFSFITALNKSLCWHQEVLTCTLLSGPSLLACRWGKGSWLGLWSTHFSADGEREEL